MNTSTKNHVDQNSLYLGKKILIASILAFSTLGTAHATEANIPASFTITAAGGICDAEPLVASKTFSYQTALSNIRSDGTLINPPDIDIDFDTNQLVHSSCTYFLEISEQINNQVTTGISFHGGETSIQIYGPGTVSSTINPIFDKAQLMSAMGSAAELTVPFILTLKAETQ